MLLLLSWFLSLLFFLNIGSSAITSVAWIPSVSSLQQRKFFITEKLNKENRIRQLNFNEAFSVEDPFIALTHLHRSPSLLIQFNFMTSAVSDFLLTGKQRHDGEFQFSVYLLV